MARKFGSKNKSTIQRESMIRDIVVMQNKYGDARIVDPSAEEITKMKPLQLMMFAMTKAAVAGNWQQAFECAKYCAPYVHAKLAMITTDVTMRRSVSDLTDDEIDALAGSIETPEDASEGEGEP